MLKGLLFSGQLNRRVSIYEVTTVKNAQGEPIETPVLIGKYAAKRIDVTGNEEEDGRLIGLNVCRYQFRFNRDVATTAGTMFIEDDGEQWEVISPSMLLEGRNRYMELKCRKRGEG